MKFQTSISKDKEGRHLIHGRDMLDIAKQSSFEEALLFLWKGSIPEEREVKLFGMLLTLALEHGIAPPSTFVPRISSSVGNPMHVALASGALAMGEKHGGAVERCAELLQSGDSAEKIVESNKIVPGFGHKTYREKDPRASLIASRANELGFSCAFFDTVYAIEKALLELKGKKLPLNIDGAMAAALLEIGLDWRFGNALFVVSRLAGSASHVVEEMKQCNPYYRLDKDDYEE